MLIPSDLTPAQQHHHDDLSRGIRILDSDDAALFLLLAGGATIDDLDALQDAIAAFAADALSSSSRPTTSDVTRVADMELALSVEARRDRELAVISRARDVLVLLRN